MDSLATFMHNVSDCLSRTTEPHACADRVAEHLAVLLQSPDFLAGEFRVPGEEQPRSHLVAVAPDGRFSVVAFVWKPGQSTCIHDHVCWCVVGVLAGSEFETGFRLMQGADGQPFLARGEAHELGPGGICRLVPPSEDIHQVRNSGSDVAISIHVYGTDVRKRGTSINCRFDHLPIRDLREGDQPAIWRDDDIAHPVGIDLGAPTAVSGAQA